MQVRVGCEITYELAQATLMLAIFNMHASRVPSFERPDDRITNPPMPQMISPAHCRTMETRHGRVRTTRQAIAYSCINC
jgi:hypothetical protein